ncbi:MAG TPA: hypothetical protein VEQ11_12745, partial [Chloroflexota bacterium]|nr:hypothetical protein [Chloroflexota bacterium]
TWDQIGGRPTGVHVDQQAIAFDPNGHRHVYLANDGGIFASRDNGRLGSWRFASRGMVATHVYVMSVSQTATLCYGGSIQDDFAYAYVGPREWSPLAAGPGQGGGEGGYVEYDPSNHEVIYHDPFASNLLKSADAGATWADLGIDTPADYAEPLAISWHDPDLLLAISVAPDEGLVRSTDGGSTWNKVLDQHFLTTVQLAPSDDHHAYAADALGSVWHSSDRGATWAPLNTNALPDEKVQCLAVDWGDPQRIYVALGQTTGTRVAGVRWLWRGDLVAAGAVTWFDASGSTPAASLPDLPLTALALHPTLDDVIYVSNMLGVLRSLDGGDSWASYDQGLPNAYVSDLDVRPRDRSLFASTMGRGIYRRFI